MGRDGVQLGHDTIDLRYVEQLADAEQTVMLGYLLKYVIQNLSDGRKTLQETVDLLFDLVDKNGMEKIYGGSYLPTGLAMPRKQEVFACLNRYRK